MDTSEKLIKLLKSNEVLTLSKTSNRFRIMMKYMFGKSWRPDNPWIPGKLLEFDSERSLRKKFLEVKDVVKSSDNILDIGTESPNTFRIAKKITGCKNVFGINIRNGFNHYKETIDENTKGFKFYDGINIPFGDESMDVITLFYVLHHIPTDEAAEKLSNDIFRVLKPGGYIVIVDHDCRNKEISDVVKYEHLIYDPDGNVICYKIEHVIGLFKWATLHEFHNNKSEINFHAKFSVVLKK